MTKIFPIRNESDYERALEVVEKLMDAEPGTEAFDLLEVWTTLIEDYEARHHAIDFPDPVEAIKFRMEQEGMKQKDLVEILGGSKSRVSELLNRKRGLSLEMIRRLHNRLKIPFENLIGENTITRAT
ncbi:helix-turn-helix domain-containing protein [Nitratifractor sp.]